MKTRHFTSIFLVALFVFTGSCKSSYDVGAELVTSDQLKMKKGFTAYLATTPTNGTVLLLEPDSPGAKQKQSSWKCTCIKKAEDQCKIQTTEGSDTAVCRGTCNCGFKEIAVPTSAQIITKTPLKATLD